MEQPSIPRTNSSLVWLRGITGIVAGAGSGLLIFKWLLSQGFYGLAIPGAMLGIGFSMAVRRRHWSLAISSAALAFFWGLYCQWSAFDRRADLSEFVSNLPQMSLWTWAMLLVGSAVAFSFFAGSEK
jgi:hypothetical protein